MQLAFKNVLRRFSPLTHLVLFINRTGGLVSAPDAFPQKKCDYSQHNHLEIMVIGKPYLSMVFHLCKPS